MLGPTEPWKNGENWFPRFYTSDHTTPIDWPVAAIPEPPPLADYDIHVCLNHGCSAMTDRDSYCGECQQHLVATYPGLAAQRDDVRNGEDSEFDGFNHTDMQTMYQAAPGRWHSAVLIWRCIIAQAATGGFKFGNFRTTPEGAIFWHDYFEEGNATI